MINCQTVVTKYVFTTLHIFKRKTIETSECVESPSAPKQIKMCWTLENYSELVKRLFVGALRFMFASFSCSCKNERKQLERRWKDVWVG